MRRRAYHRRSGSSCLGRQTLIWAVVEAAAVARGEPTVPRWRAVRSATRVAAAHTNGAQAAAHGA